MFGQGTAGVSRLSALKAMRNRWLRYFIGPVPCLLCDSLCETDLALCQFCRAELPWIATGCHLCGLPLEVSFDRMRLLCGRCLMAPGPIAASLIPLHYAPPVSDLLQRFRQSGDLIAGQALAELISLEALVRLEPGFSPSVVPVPLHPKRLAERGFNQSLELLRPLLDRTGWPLRRNLLKRSGKTPSFQSLTAEARRKSARGLFSISDSAEVPACVLLVDDFVATSTTVQAAAKTLLKAGCRRVFLLAVARAASTDSVALC